MRNIRFAAAIAVIAVGALTLTACTGDDDSAPTPNGVSQSSTPDGTSGTEGAGSGTTPETPQEVGTEAQQGHELAQVTLLGPDAAVPLAEAQEELPLIIEIAGPNGLITDTDVTFQVIDGPATYPGGFDVSTSDETGVATSLELDVTGVGTIRVQVATPELVSEVSVTVVE